MTDELIIILSNDGLPREYQIVLEIAPSKPQLARRRYRRRSN